MMKQLAPGTISRIGAHAATLLLLMPLSADPAAAGDRNATVSRQSAEIKGTASTQSATASPSTNRSASSSSRGAAVTRSNRGAKGPSGSRHYRRYPRYSWGLSYWWGYWHPYYHYPIYPTFYYGPSPARYESFGAIDLNVKPKKAEVWVDGQLLGRSGKFDGFPGYLWLGKGTHELVFHRPGFKTVAREVRVLEGAVVKLNLRLEEGETLPVEQVSAARRPARPEGRRPQPERRAERPVRVEPGRLVLVVSPEDASVYLDGRFLGTATELAKLHAGLLVDQGRHTLEVVRPGYEAERFEFSIEAAEEREIEVQLARN